MTESENEAVALRMEDVTVLFDGEPALRNVTFEVPRGETRILFGAAGSGKTVALKTSLGLIKPDSGRVFVFGRDIAPCDGHPGGIPVLRGGQI